MYTLFHSPHSQHARRVVSLMIEAGLEYQLRHVAMEKGEHLSPAYLAVNPRPGSDTVRRRCEDLRVERDPSVSLRQACAARLVPTGPC